MPPLQIVCVNPPYYTRPPRIHIPNLGIIEQALDAISSIPDPAEIMATILNMLNPLLAPLRKYLQVVEAIIAIKQCVEAIPKAIITLNPSPILDCFQALIRVIAELIKDIPPIPYIQVVLDIAAYAMDTIDAIILVFHRLEQKITDLLKLRNYAITLNDLDLVNIVNCGLRDLQLALAQILDVLRIIGPMLNIIMAVILRLIPTPQTQKASDKCIEAAASFDAAQNAAALADITTGLPKLSGLLTALDDMRKALVIIYNALAPWVGEAPNKTDRSAPTFVNF